MRIGELSAVSGTSVRSIRYYENKGLVKSKRSGNGYRDYDPETCESIKIIKACLGMGFTLKETVNILACSRSSLEPEAVCDAARVLYEGQLHKINEQIDTLQIVRERLQMLIGPETASGLDAVHAPATEGGQK